MSDPVNLKLLEHREVDLGAKVVTAMSLDILSDGTNGLCVRTIDTTTNPPTQKVWAVRISEEERQALSVMFGERKLIYGPNETKNDARVPLAGNLGNPATNGRTRPPRG